MKNTKWINIKDRRPSRNQWCLIKQQGCFDPASVAQFRKSCDDVWFFYGENADINLDDEDLIGWMPMPFRTPRDE